MSTSSSTANIAPKSAIQSGTNDFRNLQIEEESDEEKENDEQLIQSAISPPKIGKRPRINSMRSDKLKDRNLPPEISELEKRVIEVLNSYTNPVTSLKISESTSLDKMPSIANVDHSKIPAAQTNKKIESLENEIKNRVMTRSSSPKKAEL